MKITVSDISCLRRTEVLEQHDYVISLLNKAEEEKKNRVFDFPDNIKGHHIFYFDDQDDADLCDEKYKPSFDDVVGLMAAAKDIPEGSRILIHCTAGVGRSPAVALGLLAYFHRDKPDYSNIGFDEWAALPNAKHRFCPNTRIVRLFDEILDYSYLRRGHEPNRLQARLEEWKEEIKADYEALFGK